MGEKNVLYNELLKAKKRGDAAEVMRLQAQINQLTGRFEQPPGPTRNAPSKYTVQPGDSLTTIAEKLFGDQRAFFDLFLLNMDQFGYDAQGNPNMTLRPGQVLNTQMLWTPGGVIPSGFTFGSYGPGNQYKSTTLASPAEIRAKQEAARKPYVGGGEAGVLPGPGLSGGAVGPGGFGITDTATGSFLNDPQGNPRTGPVEGMAQVPSIEGPQQANISLYTQSPYSGRGVAARPPSEAAGPTGRASGPANLYDAVYQQRFNELKAAGYSDTMAGLYASPYARFKSTISQGQGLGGYYATPPSAPPAPGAPGTPATQAHDATQWMNVPGGTYTDRLQVAFETDAANAALNQASQVFQDTLNQTGDIDAARAAARAYLPATISLFAAMNLYNFSTNTYTDANGVEQPFTSAQQFLEYMGYVPGPNTNVYVLTEPVNALSGKTAGGDYPTTGWYFRSRGYAYSRRRQGYYGASGSGYHYRGGGYGGGGHGGGGGSNYGYGSYAPGLVVWNSGGLFGGP